MKLFFVMAMTAALSMAEESATFKGVITDSMCGTNHAMMDHKGPEADCVKVCIKSDPAKYKYVLVDGKKTYKLSDQAAPEKFAAKKVVVKGKLFEKTGVIKVESIRPAS